MKTLLDCLVNKSLTKIESATLGYSTVASLGPKVALSAFGHGKYLSIE